eukprot:6212907-Pleurochrysis_carterae.AAC.1
MMRRTVRQRAICNMHTGRSSPFQGSGAAQRRRSPGRKSPPRLGLDESSRQGVGRWGARQGYPKPAVGVAGKCRRQSAAGSAPEQKEPAPCEGLR